MAGAGKDVAGRLLAMTKKLGGGGSALIGAAALIYGVKVSGETP